MNEPTWQPTDLVRRPRPRPEDGPIVETRSLSRDYRVGSSTVHAVRDVSLSIDRAELVAIRGRSGSGKTTLLSMIGGLDRPTSGEVRVDG
jgi:putative ABC transport system ATP-binding protein